MATPAEDSGNIKKHLCCLSDIPAFVRDTMTGKEHMGAIMEVTVLLLVFHHGHLSLSRRKMDSNEGGVV